MTDTYDLNDTPALTVTITDKSAVVIDPTILTFKAISPTGAATTYVYGTDAELVKDSTGVYHVDFLLNTSGRWSFNWTATGNVSIAEHSEAWVRYSGRAVTLEQAKDHLNITDSLDDASVDFMIDSAVMMVEQQTGKALITSAKSQLFGCFSSALRLYSSNVDSIASITYLGVDDVEQTLAASVYDLDKRNAEVLLAPGQSWPTISQKVNPVTVNYTAGYGASAASIPPPLVSAVLLLIGNFYENRESIIVGTISAELPMSVGFLIAPFKDYSS